MPMTDEEIMVLDAKIAAGFRALREERDALAERLEIAAKALTEISNNENVGYAANAHQIGRFAGETLAAIAAHEAERGERMSDGTFKCWKCKREIPEAETKWLPGIGTQCLDKADCKAATDNPHNYVHKAFHEQTVEALRVELAVEREKTRIAVNGLAEVRDNSSPEPRYATNLLRVIAEKTLAAIAAVKP